MIKDGGFYEQDIIFASNATYAEFCDKLKEFKKRISQLKEEGGCVAVLFYAGHGMMGSAVNTHGNYILPSDFKLDEDPNYWLTRKAFKLEGEHGVLSRMEPATAAIAIFNACRTPGVDGTFRSVNCSTGSDGKLRGMLGMAPTEIPGNMLLAFASGAHMAVFDGYYNDKMSPYARALDEVCGRTACLWHPKIAVPVSHPSVCGWMPCLCPKLLCPCSYASCTLQELCNREHANVFFALSNAHQKAKTYMGTQQQQPRLEITCNAELFQFKLVC